MLEATIDMFMGFLIFPAADSVSNLCVHACYSLMSRGTFVFPYMCAFLCVCVCVCVCVCGRECRRYVCACVRGCACACTPTV